MKDKDYDMWASENGKQWGYTRRIEPKAKHPIKHKPMIITYFISYLTVVIINSMAIVILLDTARYKLMILLGLLLIYFILYTSVLMEIASSRK